MKLQLRSKTATLHHGDCVEWLAKRPENSIHGVVTDPPYGLVEYSEKELGKMRAGSGGVWRIPPAFDGYTRAPLPRFTTLRPEELKAMSDFFTDWTKAISRVLDAGALRGGFGLRRSEPSASRVGPDLRHYAEAEQAAIRSAIRLKTFVREW